MTSDLNERKQEDAAPVEEKEMLWKRKKVVVIGAGAAGLVSLKEHLAAGSEAVCFEATQHVGGVFSTRTDAAYDGLFLTTSNVYMSFSDLPWPEPYIRYSPKEEYARYLETYADHFHLRQHIRFGARVTSAKWDSARRQWAVAVVEQATPPGDDTSKKQKKPAEEEVVFADALCVATGANSAAKSVAGVAPGFEGAKIHSQDFQNAEPYRGLDVLVVGSGESATDISSDLSVVAKSTTVWARRPFLIAPRFPELIQKDPTHDEYAIMREKWAGIPMSEFLEFINTSRFFNALPLWLWAGLRQSFWEVCQADTSTSAPAFRATARWSQLMWQSEEDASTRRRAYWQADQAAFATKNSRIASMVAQDRVRLVVARQADFGPRSVTFSDVLLENATRVVKEGGSKTTKTLAIDNIDAVVCCVGYETRFSFLDMPALGISSDPRDWYKHCFPPGFDGGELAFVGFARGHQGGIPQLAELLARYHALILSGERALPDDYATRARDEGAVETEYFFLTPGLRSLVDYTGFADSVARLIGCEPRMPNFFFQPAFFIKYWLYPMWPCWFRLRGPGANRDAALTVLRDRFPLSKLGPLPPPPYVVCTLFLPIQHLCNAFAWLFDRGTKRASLSAGFLWNRSKLFILHGNPVRFFV